MKFNGEEYYEWVLMYVDNILATSMDPIAILKSMEGDTVKYKKVRLSHKRCIKLSTAQALFQML